VTLEVTLARLSRFFRNKDPRGELLAPRTKILTFFRAVYTI